MSKIAFVFPGQGAQQTGMGMDLIEKSQKAKEVFDQANELLDFDLYDLCLKEDAPIHETAYTQPALLAVSMCLYHEFVSHTGIVPDFTAGLSLGEYSALVASESLLFEDAIQLVRKRGLYMEEAGSKTQGAMAAVIKADSELVKRYCDEDPGVVQIANFNSPIQVVISGEKEAVERVSKRLSDEKIRVMPLKVSGAFHSPLMESAATKFKAELDAVEFNQIKVPYITNVTGEAVTDHSTTKDLLVDQLKESVQWEKSIQSLIDQGVETFVEIGPGNTLAGLIKKINKDVKVFNVSDFDSIHQVKEQVKGA